MISILILTLNEEKNLPACLETCKWSDDIHVLDSYSTDHTANIARAYGAKVWFRKFDSFSQHQNWALENIPFKHPWVFYYDADERITPQLAVSMQAAVRDPGMAVAFRIQRRDFFLNRWLKHVQMTPFYERLFRPEKMRYERLGHCISRPDGPVAAIPGYLDHFPFSKGIGEWIAKHNFYSAQEAQQILNNWAENSRVSIRKTLFEKSAHERRRNLKELYYRMPARPLLKFLVMYIGKRGFLDGSAGFAYSVLIAFYEYMIVLKLRELEQLQSAPSIVLPQPEAETARRREDRPV
jgi:glycosyltransferase involved in cell wall biosynthesis